MNIKWNKVTWYSKTLAVILFLIVLYVGICIGRRYEQVKAIQAVSPILKNGTVDFKAVQEYGNRQ
ncbi:MAG: hypothetical protein H0U27_03520 [Nitrosopumilus sp.]|nr:hypothetical protein [Nitrosopumilus sp.]MBA3551118.1 hypothetical protein [Patescibacteria group bacterium]